MTLENKQVLLYATGAGYCLKDMDGRRFAVVPATSTGRDNADLSYDEALKARDAWRKANPAVVEFWEREEARLNQEMWRVQLTDFSPLEERITRLMTKVTKDKKPAAVVAHTPARLRGRWG